MAVEVGKKINAVAALTDIAIAEKTYAARTFSAAEIPAPMPAPTGWPPQETIRAKTFTLDRTSSGAAIWR